jgi:hypothetical protein
MFVGGVYRKGRGDLCYLIVSGRGANTGLGKEEPIPNGRMQNRWESSNERDKTTRKKLGPEEFPPVRPFRSE